VIYRTDITAERTRQLLSYDKGAGTLTWKTRTPDMFEGRKRAAETCCKIWNRKFAGKRAGGHDCHKGYRTVAIEGGRYMEHRIIWLIVYGRWPKDQIDHSHGNKGKNTVDGLREAHNSQNHQNQKNREDNSSGHTGVSWHKGASKWTANIDADSRHIYLGLFSKKQDAIDAYLAAKRKYHSFQPVPRD
jgi:hypothetical protein